MAAPGLVPPVPHLGQSPRPPTTGSTASFFPPPKSSLSSFQPESILPRSIPTTSNDRIYCKILAHNAVHAAFAGYTGITGEPAAQVRAAQLASNDARGPERQNWRGCHPCPFSPASSLLSHSKVGLVNTHYVYLPIPVIIQVGGGLGCTRMAFGAGGVVTCTHTDAQTSAVTHVCPQAPRKVDPRGKAWNRLRASIGQVTTEAPAGCCGGPASGSLGLHQPQRPRGVMRLGTIAVVACFEALTHNHRHHRQHHHPFNSPTLCDAQTVCHQQEGRLRLGRRLRGTAPAWAESFFGAARSAAAAGE